MAVQPQTPYKEYTANGSTKSFALEFDCDNQDHLIVLVDDIEPVVGAWSLIGGAVVFGTAPTNGKKITIQRNTPFRRDGDFQSYDNSFRPGPVNKGFDWVWLKLQELGVADWILSNRIDALKAYVDDRDDELRAYLLEEILKQGVALDQLEDYYNYLMQRLAQIAVDKGWEASFVVSADGSTQQQVNDRIGNTWYDKPLGYELNAQVMLTNGDIVKSTIPNNTINPNNDMTGWVYVNKSVKSVADLLLLKGSDGNAVELTSYHFDRNRGGGIFYYDSTKSTVNDGVAVFNGWVRQLDNNTLTPYMAGAKADYIDQTNKGTDDSSAFQKVIAYFKENPCVIECDPLAKHYIANPVIIPDYTDIRGNGAQLFGNARTNDCFYTGYYVGNTLTSLVDASENTKFLTNTKLRGFRYRYFKSSMKLRGMTQGCAIEDVRSRDCDQHLWSHEHYFCTFRQSYADHCGLGSGLPVDERTAVYDLRTLSGMINIETIQCSSAPLAYTFYSLQATELSHLDAEACETAIRLKGEIENPDIHSCYFENCGVVLDVSGSIVMGGAFRNNFINGCTTGILGALSSCNINEFDNRWRGTIGEKSRGSGSFRVYSKSDNLIKAYNATYPADNTPNGIVTNKNTGYAINNGSSEQLVSVYDDVSGSNLMLAKSYMGSTVPFVYFGKYPIANKTNNIPFCSHVAGAIQPDNTFSIRITTSIAYSEFVRGDFALYINTTNTAKYVFGKFFGLNCSIEYNGFTSFTPTITIENVSGVIVIVLSGIKNTNNLTTYQCRGIVKLA